MVKKALRKLFSSLIIIVLSVSLILPQSYAQTIPSFSVSSRNEGSLFFPPLIRGIALYPENPFKMDFFIDQGDEAISQSQLKEESQRMIKYFLASLAVPEKDMWVNLSPYEKDRIVPDVFGKTIMGRDLLLQDYFLKNLTASLLLPENETGKKFWDKVYQLTAQKVGATEIPIDLFHKIWIVPDEATIFINQNNVFIVKSHLKVMLEEDYLSLKNQNEKDKKQSAPLENSKLTSFMREIVIPEIEREVNGGKTFVHLRQMYHAMVLATWYKENLKNSVLKQSYADQNNVKGVESDKKVSADEIYNEYLKVFQDGIYSRIKEEYDPLNKTIVARKYFTGGVRFDASAQKIRIDGSDSAMKTLGERTLLREQVELMNVTPKTKEISSQKLIGLRSPNPVEIGRILSESQIFVMGKEDLLKVAEYLKAGEQSKNDVFKMSFPFFDEEMLLTKDFLSGKISLQDFYVGIARIHSANLKKYPLLDEVVFRTFNPSQLEANGPQIMGSFSIVQNNILYVYTKSNNFSGVLHELYENVIAPFYPDIKESRRNKPMHTMAVLAETGLFDSLLLPRVSEQLSQMRLQDLDAFIFEYNSVLREIEDRFPAGSVHEGKRQYALLHAQTVFHAAQKELEKKTEIFKVEELKRLEKMLGDMEKEGEGIIESKSKDVLDRARIFYEKTSVVRTGGTLEMKGKFARKTAHAISQMVAKYHNRIGYSVKAIPNLPDSSNIGIAEWQKIIKKLKQIIELKKEIRDIFEALGVSLGKPSGIVVTTGTDTVDQLGMVLSLELLPYIEAPIVLTAAALPLGQPRSDVQANFSLALRTVSDKKLSKQIYFVYANTVHLASRIKKFIAGDRKDGQEGQEGSADDFQSYGSLVAKYDPENKQMIYQNGVKDFKIDLHLWARLPGNFDRDFVEHIALSEATPVDVLKDVLNRMKEQKKNNPQNRYGIVLQGKKIKDKNNEEEMKDFKDVLLEFYKEEIPVLVGSTETAESVEGSGVIVLPHFLNFAKARTKLAWLLAKGADFKDIPELIRTDFAGEIAVSEDRKSAWNIFPLGHMYENIAENNFKNGQEVVIGYPNISSYVFADAIQRLNRSGKRRRALVVYGFGDGNLPLGEASLNDRISQWVKKANPKMFVEIESFMTAEKTSYEDRKKKKVLKNGKISREMFKEMDAEVVFKSLIEKGYIDSDGNVLNKFGILQDVSEMEINENLNQEKRKIFSILLDQREKEPADLFLWERHLADAVISGKYNDFFEAQIQNYKLKEIVDLVDLICCRSIENVTRGSADIEEIKNRIKKFFPQEKAKFFENITAHKELKDLLKVVLESINKEDVSKKLLMDSFYARLIVHRIIKTILMESHPILFELGKAEEQGIDVEIRTVASMSLANIKTYELGNMELAAGLNSEKEKGFVNLLIPKKDDFLKVKDNALLSSQSRAVGGIDFNSDLLNLENQGLVEAINFQFNKEAFNGVVINGLTPHIINIIPVANLPALLGINN